MYQKHTRISIVIPLYNSGKRIYPLYRALIDIISIDSNYEVIFVDDGSKDNTAEVIKVIKNQDLHVRMLRSENNMGQYAALFAGYKCSKGDIVINIDDDAFEEVSYIPEFIKKINEGYDMVLGWRIKKGYPIFRKFASFLFNIIISLVIGRRIHDIGSSLKAKSRKVIDKLVSSNGLLPFLKQYKYYKITEVIMSCGYSKGFSTRYSILKLIKGAILILKNNIFKEQKYSGDSIESYIEVGSI